MSSLAPARISTAGLTNFSPSVTMHFERKKAILSHYVTPHKARDFTGLCALRNGLHYVSFVDPRGDGHAEAFLRFETSIYLDLFADYLAALRAHGSQLPFHLTPSAVPELATR